MTTTQGNLAGLSRFIFRAPRWYSSMAFAILLAAVAGVAAFDTPGQFFWQDAWQGVFFIGIPTIVAGGATAAVDRWLDGQLTPNRSSLLALACEMLLVAILTVVGVIAVLTPLDQHFVFDALLVGLASIFAVRLLVVMAVSRQSLPIATIPASLQTLSAAVLLFIYSGTLRLLEIGGPIAQVYFSRPEEAPPELLVIVPQDFGLLAVLCLLYAGLVWGFVTVLDRPWRRNMGVSVLDFLRGFIGHIAEGSRELETFFEALGEEAVVPVTVLSFRRSADGTEKARFVLPMIHPGPMGEIGGGNLPERVAADAEGLAFPPHATAGHDFNLVTAREVDTLIETANMAYSTIEYHDTASEATRVEEGEAKVLGQAFGEDLLAVATYSPGFADDVEYAVGLSAMAEARSGGFDDVLLVDAHNCNDGLTGEDLGHVVPGSARSFDMMQAAGGVAQALADAPREPVSLGTAWDRTRWDLDEGIGPLGIRVAVVEVGAQRTGYVLVDGNNMEPGLRDRIVDELSDRLEVCEVMTTDTHIVNMTKSVNQVGDEIDHDELLAAIAGLVDAAIDDLEPVEAGMASERAEVTVFGNDRTESLASHANVMISMGGALAAAIVLFALTVSILIFFLV